MHTMDVLHGVVHVHRNLLPSDKAQVALFQKCLVFHVGNCLDDTHDFTLQIHQCFDVLLDAFLKVDNDDNPQLIFESLNSTGLDLSEGDKIRNFILMGLPSKAQDEYYDKYWNRIEECTRYDVSSFVRDYLSVKQLAIPSQKKIYVNFKEYVEQQELSAEGLLKDLLSYAKRYEILLKGGTKSKALNACIYRLNRLETTVTRPFFLEVLRLLDSGKIDMQQVTEVFLITENYLFIA